jgi:NitT/TauT family transport system substrate-binding protein
MQATMRMLMRCLALLAMLALGSTLPRPVIAADLTPVVIGNIPSLTGAPLYIAKDKGYYEALGLDVQLTNAGSPADQAALLTTNRLQLVGGAVTAGFFNAFARKLPVTLVLSRAVSPINHYLMARVALRGVLKKPADLKGRIIALDQTGTDLSYELLKTLQAAGMTMADVQVKFLPFSEQPAALATGAIDLALMISPLQDATEAKGIAFRFLNTDPYITPRPMAASVLEMNKDWAAEHPDAAKNFVIATLKATRYYCDAYHHGANRADVVRILAKYSNVQDPALIEKIDWTSMDPEGKIPLTSIMDIQDFYIKDKLVSTRVPETDLMPLSFVGTARQTLGAYKVARDDHRPGCR